ncbi:hypothetical protein XENOCAPTIV_022098 [Xenoophorus captivus]|uniref:Secreted protein n=1 Tax=Xenoophorus captivus TaxID=1517983 RepID=A0ABV0RRV4_9TELE
MVFHFPWCAAFLSLSPLTACCGWWGGVYVFVFGQLPAICICRLHEELRYDDAGVVVISLSLSYRSPAQVNLCLLFGETCLNCMSASCFYKFRRSPVITLRRSSLPSQLTVWLLSQH